MDFKNPLYTTLKKQLGQDIELQIPKPEFGDFSLPCFKLGNPNKIIKKIKLPNYIEKAEIKSQYINFFIKKQILAEKTIKQILKERNNYGKLKKTNKKIVIESPGPNTNKPLHLGHLRNMVLGLSLINLQKAIGKTAIPVDIINDRGIHIAKSALAYKRFGKNKKPDKKPDHFVGDFYVLFSKESSKNLELEKEAQELLKKYEENDKETILLFKKMNKWAIQGIKETYRRIGIKTKKSYYESNYYQKGKSIVFEGLKKGIFKKDKEGNIIADLKESNLGEKVLLRTDGTSIYITQDLYLALKRHQDFKMDKMLYIVASEQIHHFKVLFKLLELLNYTFAKNYQHLAYGMIYLPEGKMKSREGKVVDADDLLNEMHNLTKKEILKRNKNLTKKELEIRSEIISQSAIKFFLLKYDPMKDFTFYPEQSISFEGDTGPYIQYTYARNASILRKAKKLTPIFKFTTEEEYNITKLLLKFPEIIKESATRYKTQILAQYLLELCHLSNEFYHKYNILKSDEKTRNSRLTLIKAINNVLSNGLNILSIKTLEEM